MQSTLIIDHAVQFKGDTMKHLFLAFAFTLFAVTMGFAQQSDQSTATTKKTETVTIAVESIQCGMCKKNLEKAVKKVEGVEKVKVDLDTKIASVTFLPAKTNLESLENAIIKAGYSANEKKPDAEAYEKLDECCKLSDE